MLSEPQLLPPLRPQSLLLERAAWMRALLQSLRSEVKENIAATTRATERRGVRRSQGRGAVDAEAGEAGEG